MDNLPLVSIITPSYNQGLYLEETILSVLHQDYPNIEYILIDGASTDTSREIIRRYEKHLSYWVSEPDRGQTDAILKGFKQAKGVFFGWLCSDDILEPSMVSLAVDRMLKNKTIGLTFGDRVRIDAKGNIFSQQRYAPFSEVYLRLGMTLPQETVLFRRDIYEKTGGLNPELKMAMDYDLWCRLSRLTDFGYIPTYLGRFRSHATNKSTIFSQTQRSNGFQKGYPEEFANVYRKFFSGSPHKELMEMGKFIQQLSGWLYRRTSKYRLETNRIQAIRLGGI